VISLFSGKESPRISAKSRFLFTAFSVSVYALQCEIPRNQVKRVMYASAFCGVNGVCNHIMTFECYYSAVINTVESRDKTVNRQRYYNAATNIINDCITTTNVCETAFLYVHCLRNKCSVSYLDKKSFISPTQPLDSNFIFLVIFNLMHTI